MTITYTPPSIEHDEYTEPPSPIEQDGENGFEATRHLRCAWADRHDLIEQLRYAYTVVQSGRVYLVGSPYPYRSGVYAVSVSDIQPKGRASVNSNGTIDWQYADLTVKYRTKAFDPGGATGGSGSEPAEPAVVADETLTTSAEFLTVSGEKLFWVSDQAGQEEADDSDNLVNQLDPADYPGRLIRLIEWNYSYTEQDGGTGSSGSSGGSTFEGLPPGITTYPGYVNSTSVTSSTLGKTFDAETLLYQGVDARRKILSSGAAAWEISLRFTYRPIGTWNKFFKGGNSSPQEIYHKADGSAGTQAKPYPTVDFSSELGV